MRVRPASVVAFLLLGLLALMEVLPSEGSQFYTNSRYGKRVPGPASNLAKLWGISRRRNNIEPRTDKFFLNSRYGKRASSFVDDTAAEESMQTVATPDSDDPTLLQMAGMVCRFTGINELYRCFPLTRKNAIDHSEGGSNSNVAEGTPRIVNNN